MAYHGKNHGEVIPPEGMDNPYPGINSKGDDDQDQRFKHGSDGYDARAPVATVYVCHSATMVWDLNVFYPINQPARAKAALPSEMMFFWSLSSLPRGYSARVSRVCRDGILRESPALPRGVVDMIAGVVVVSPV